MRSIFYENEMLRESDTKGLTSIIACAATMTGLPGVIAGAVKDKNISVFGVRTTKMPGPAIIEDASSAISSMPEGVPLAYCGFNQKGFLHACMIAAKIDKITK